MGGTPYWLILPVMVGWLVARHAYSPTASERSKQIVVGLTAGGFLLVLAWSAAVIPVSLLLMGVGVYIILHREVTLPDELPELPPLPRVTDRERDRK